MKTRRQNIQTGFTIVELMIATLVFSIILIVITTAVMHFTTSYYRGITSGTTQTTTRNAIDVLSQAIQFSGSSISSTPPPVPPAYSGAVCIGSQTFSYNLGMKLGAPAGPDTSTQVLWQTTSAGGGCAIDFVNPAGKELMGKNMRLAKLSVKPLAGTNLWTVSMRAVYGDIDLLCNPSVSPSTAGGGCAKTAIDLSTTQKTASADLACKTVSGSQFCAVSALSTTVLKRMVQ